MLGLTVMVSVSAIISPPLAELYSSAFLPEHMEVITVVNDRRVVELDQMNVDDNVKS